MTVPGQVYDSGSTPGGFYEIRVPPSDTLKAKQDTITSVQRLAEGRKLYEKNCGKCHLLYEPGDFELSVWKKNLDEMSEKADLSESTRDLILLYLSSNCKK